MNQICQCENQLPHSLCNGHMFVKLANGERGVGIKVWNKKWVSIKSETFAQHNGFVNGVAIYIYRSEKSAESKSQNDVYKKYISPHNAVIFRCSSRTHKYAFTICINAKPVIHLSGSSESESQRWMMTLRNYLWPPNPLIGLEKSLGDDYYVSLIDNKSSYHAGLLGSYGYMSITTKKVILSHPQTGHVIQEWYLSTVGFKKVEQSHDEDKNSILEMISDTSSSTGDGVILFYCERGNELIERVHNVRQLFESNSSSTIKRYTDELQEHMSGNDYQHYQIPNSSPKCVIDAPIFGFRNRLIDEPKEFVNNKFHIPESMLNCSINSTTNFRAYIEDKNDREKLFEENIYENMEQIYEELVFSDDKYSGDNQNQEFNKPPLPPKRRKFLSQSEDNESTNLLISFDNDEHEHEHEHEYGKINNSNNNGEFRKILNRLNEFNPQEFSDYLSELVKDQSQDDNGNNYNNDYLEMQSNVKNHYKRQKSFESFEYVEMNSILLH